MSGFFRLPTNVKFTAGQDAKPSACRTPNFTGQDKIMEGKIMILSAMIWSSQGWIRKRLLVPPSGQKFGHPCKRGDHGNSMGAAEG